MAINPQLKKSLLGSVFIKKNAFKQIIITVKINFWQNYC